MSELKDIGIITMYHKSKNYGGLLQAYALTEVISKLNYTSEQIKWQHIKKNKHRRGLISKVFSKNVFGKIIKLPVIIKIKITSKRIKNWVELRNRKFEEFEESIPHSRKSYTQNDIQECNSLYKGFITGSDQVWNMSWYNQEYFLTFVNDDKYKFSYAASMPDTDLSPEKKELVHEHLKSFNDISTRESEAAAMLSDLLNVEVKTVLDPTLLLSADDWDNICTNRIIKDKYIFCYFLSDAKNDKKIAKAFAKKTGLKIATIPHLNGVNINDMGFADLDLYDMGPREFISLIKHAEYVITDSFHATVFSNIYKVKHFVFPRINICKMDSRIVDLLSLFDESERFCNSNEKRCVNYLFSLKDEKLKDNTPNFDLMKKHSIQYLETNLKKVGTGDY